MTPNSRPRVVLLSAPGTLAGIDPLLRAAGVRLFRITSITTRPLAPEKWLPRLGRTPRPDTVIVTSRASVTYGVVPWRKHRIRTTLPVEFWAAGPGTADALRAAGIRRVRTPRRIGASGILGGLSRGPRRNILYFRSDIAGPALARRLRDRGHRVIDVTVYRTEQGTGLLSGAQQELARADLLIATSPSTLSSLRRGLVHRSLLRLQQNVPVVVLGERSQRAARGHGFHRVSVAPSPNAQRFTRYLLRELRDGSP
jgi:uroporphyrinogen-III synthase